MQPSDILFFSKFGKQEAKGGGFRAEIAFAVGEGRMALTAVKRGLVHNWLAFTGGLGATLDHRLRLVRNSWSDIALASAKAA